jgi:hypothetical protein
MSINCNKCTFTYDIEETMCPICSNYNIEPTKIKQLTLVEENMIKAYEEIPHTLIQTKSAIYIKGYINGNEISFLLDTGAEMSIIPYNFIRACNMEDIIDTKYKGRILGVGEASIVGRIHYVEVLLDNVGILPCAFTVSSNNDLPAIIGIDMMHHLGIVINFMNKTLLFSTNETTIKF